MLMPGLSDAHWHAMLVRPTPAQLLSSDIGYSTLLAGAEATATLMRGFTSVRDMGGPVFALKRAIDDQLLPGPASTLQALSSRLAAATEISVSSATCQGPMAGR